MTLPTYSILPRASQSLLTIFEVWTEHTYYNPRILLYEEAMLRGLPEGSKSSLGEKHRHSPV